MNKRIEFIDNRFLLFQGLIWITAMCDIVQKQPLRGELTIVAEYDGGRE